MHVLNFRFSLISLPSEILLSILVYAVGSIIGNRRLHFRTKAAISLTCRHLYTLREAFVDLWSDCLFVPDRDKMAHYHLIQHLPHGPIDARWKLEDYPSPESSTRVTASEVIESTVHLLDVAERIFLVLGAAVSYPRVMAELRNTDATGLRSLAITRVPACAVHLTGPSPVPEREPGLFALSKTPHLQYIRLNNASIGWKDAGSFSNAKVISFNKILPPLEPDSVQLLDIFAAAAGTLERLSIRKVWCNQLPPDYDDFIILPRLFEIDLGFTGLSNIVGVFTRVYAPCLRKATVLIDSPSDVQLLLECRALFASVTELTVVGYGNFGPDLSQFYVAMPNVQILDLPRVHWGYMWDRGCIFAIWRRGALRIDEWAIWNIYTRIYNALLARSTSSVEKQHNI
ncbi:hypothetical protein DFH09DRAFT_1100754 [Mycena vulgaris]|nr:hypothetical protein DFH09DRAFT_1100754 [Mycena vulgaris]